MEQEEQAVSEFLVGGEVELILVADRELAGDGGVKLVTISHIFISVAIKIWHQQQEITSGDNNRRLHLETTTGDYFITYILR